LIEIIEQFVANLFNGNSYLATFFISMVPIIELKGAIPFGMSANIFGKKALNPLGAWSAAALGSLVPALFLVWLFIPLMRVLKNTKLFKTFSERLENKFNKNAENINKSSENKNKKKLYKWLGLMIFVAVPLPLTGAYTGSAIAGYLGLSYIESILAILTGNIIAGGIVVLLCTIFKGYEMWIFIGFLIVLMFAIFTKVVLNLLKKKQRKQEIKQ